MDVRLTKLTAAAGCAAKLGRADLHAALSQLMPAADPRLLVGPETFDDAAVLRVADDLAICFTADFITPLVDDPAAWGRIAATNAISDIYAMGAVPLAALNLVCWPTELPINLLQQVLAGGAAAAAAAHCIVAGGHSISDPEPKYGMAVIGTVSPARFLRNQGAQPGDAIYLTKPLGTGIVTTAIKADLAQADHVAAAIESMTTLNRAAAAAATAVPVHALTDVTGFSLAGHLTEMLGADGRLGAHLAFDALPQLPGVREYMSMGLIPAGAYRNRNAFRDRVELPAAIGDEVDMLFYDPQTSGGLLAAVPADAAVRFEAELTQRGARGWRIGTFDASGRIHG